MAFIVSSLAVMFDAILAPELRMLPKLAKLFALIAHSVKQSNGGKSSQKNASFC